MIGLTEVALQAGFALAGLAVLAALLPPRHRNLLAGATLALFGASGVTAGVATLAGLSGDGLSLPLALPLAGHLDPLRLAPDALGAVFLILVGVVVGLAAVFGIGYAHGPVASRTGWSAFAVFALGLQLVPAAADVLSFLFAWELMAIGSTVLLLADHAQREPVRRATAWYAVMTHLSFLALLAGFGVLAAAAGGTSWARIGAASIPESTASMAFVLLTVGFATKAGLVPMHVWLPRAHPEAPSHVSAVMSAAMVKMGCHGLALVTLRLLPTGPSWWALLLIVLGAGSALYGILQASVQSDLKRLLAYSTTENVGLIVTALGVGLLLHDCGQTGPGNVALVAALLLALSHAAFKTVLFLGAGAVLHATGERDLDDLGGLAARMPWTASALGIGAMGAAALPVTSGFVAEWTLLQAVIHADPSADRLLAVVLPLTMGVVALTIGLGLFTFVKAFGIGFLARPRTPAAAAAIEVGWSMRAALLAAAGLTVGLGLFPGPVARALATAVGADAIASAGLTGLGLGPLGDVLLNPLALTVLTLAVAAPLVVGNLVLAARAPRQDVELAWGCGGERTSPRMEYNATSYAEPLVRAFGGSLRPKRTIDVVNPDDAPLLVEEVSFSQRTVDLVDERIYLPASRALLRVGDLARRLHNGSIHRYLAFSGLALVLVLVVVSR